jgi:Tfp pilus assembly protein PilO
MIGNSLLIQVIMAGIAIGIVITYIQPTLGEISLRQDEIAQTKEELEEINNVNDRLETLYTQLTAIQSSDKAALFTYLPDTVDEVQVLKDISRMAEDSGIVLNGLDYIGVDEAEGSTGAFAQPFAHSFSASFVSTYEQMKNFLLRLEQNNYPLNIKALTSSPNEGGLIDVSLALVTYSHKE